MDSSEKLRSYSLGAVIGMNILLSLHLLLSYTAPYVNPEEIAIIPFFGLTYPIALIMNLVFIMVWGILKSKWFFLSSSLVLIGIPFHLRVFSIQLSDNTIPENANTIKIMSYNVRLFGYYEDNKSKAKQRKTDIIKFIQKEAPDVLCLQEYFTKDEDPYFNTLNSIYNVMSINDHHEKSKYNRRKRTHFGIAIFSKYSIINKGYVHKEIGAEGNSNFCIYADIVKKKDTFRIYNVHLQSIKLETDEYTQQTNMNTDGSSTSRSYKSGISKLNKAFKIRSVQSKTLNNHIAGSPYKSIICGDFNDTPLSYTYQLFNTNLIDAFRNTSSGFGSTYSGYLPAGRIDYIFHTKTLNSAKFEIQKEKLSDHLAISCTIF